jgi:primosomal protein N' (replication factor Y)
MPAPIALVAVDQAAFHFDKPYSYLLPAELGPVSRGCRVMVPFGGGDRRRQGIVMALDQTDTPEKLKPILAVLDEEPLLSEEMLDLAVFMKERTFCTLFDAVRAMLPTGLYMKIRPAYRPAARVTPEMLEALSDEERRLYKRVCALAERSENGADRGKLLGSMGLSADSDLPERLIR